jgi:hypothetical protein
MSRAKSLVKEKEKERRAETTNQGIHRAKGLARSALDVSYTGAPANRLSEAVRATRSRTFVTNPVNRDEIRTVTRVDWSKPVILINLTNLRDFMNKLIAMLLAAVFAGVSFNAIAQAQDPCKGLEGKKLDECKKAEAAKTPKK